MKSKIAAFFIVLTLIFGIILLVASVFDYFSKKAYTVNIEDLKNFKIISLNLDKKDYNHFKDNIEDITKNKKIILNLKLRNKILDNITDCLQISLDKIDSINYYFCDVYGKYYLIKRKIDYRIRESIFEIDKQTFEEISKLIETQYSGFNILK